MTASARRPLQPALLRSGAILRWMSAGSGTWVYSITGREYLQILDSVVAGDLEVAAAQMRRYLQRASRLRQHDRPN